jgi:hypothetical protein
MNKLLFLDFDGVLHPKYDGLNPFIQQKEGFFTL